MILLTVISVLVFVAFMRIMFLKKHASAFEGGDEKLVANIKSLLHKHPIAGMTIVTLTVIQYGLVLLMFVLLLNKIS